MALVSHEHRFIYMKTRKTAGTSIEMLLQPLCTPPGHALHESTPAITSTHGCVGRRLVPDVPKNSPDYSVWREHMASRTVRHQIGTWKWATYSKLTSVRNPFDRAVSSFYWRADFDGEILPESFDARRALFKEFAHSDKMKNDEAIARNWKHNFIKTAIRYEHLVEDLDKFCKKLKLPVSARDLPYTKSNTSRRKYEAVSDHFDAQTTQVIRNKMAWVFDHFDYSTNPADCDV